MTFDVGDVIGELGEVLELGHGGARFAAGDGHSIWFSTEVVEWFARRYGVARGKTEVHESCAKS